MRRLEAHGLVEDDGLSRAETTQADEAWEATFRPAKPKKSAERADDGSAAEHRTGVALVGRLWEHWTSSTRNLTPLEHPVKSPVPRLTGRCETPDERRFTR